MKELRSITCWHDGVLLRGLVALPQAPFPHPAVLVMSNAFGIGEQTKQLLRLLAREGYLAVAADMYGDGMVHGDWREAEACAGLLREMPDLLRSRVNAWLSTLKQVPDVDPDRVAAIGYCFGGHCALELARSGAELELVMSFYGLLRTSLPAAPGTMKSYVAVYTGACDPYAPRNHVAALREEMTAARAQWQISEFGEVYHAFTDPGVGMKPVGGQAYDFLADKVSWANAFALLENKLRNVHGRLASDQARYPEAAPFYASELDGEFPCAN
jgi:dienelactone hydrolase